MKPLRELGRYALFEEMATGGMATVHLGRLLGSAGFARTVVIKRMKAELAEDNEFVEMFVDEARLASRVQHPNVVSTLDVVRDGKELFIVMDYVHGRSLDELIAASQIRSQKIPPRIVSALGVQALLGLHAAHEATSDSGDPLELVHRDFSPHNVLVDVDGAARVVDFGVAKAAQKLHKTRDGQVKGKWAYMSPEQVEGDALDRRSDIFAAGIVLWEALTCKRLFSHDNPAKVATDIVYKEAKPPSTHAKKCPPELDAVVLKALSKDPEDRYTTAKEMAKALRKAQAPTDVLDVSSWLEEIAGPEMEDRAERVAAIEKASSGMVVVPDTAAVSLIDARIQPELAEAIEESRRSSPTASAPEIAKRTLIGGTSSPVSRPKTKRKKKRESDEPEAVKAARKMRLEDRPDELAEVIRAASEHTQAPSTPKVTPDRESEPESAPESEEEPESVDESIHAPDDDPQARRRLFVGLAIAALAIATGLVLALGGEEKPAAPKSERRLRPKTVEPTSDPPPPTGSLAPPPAISLDVASARPPAPSPVRSAAPAASKKSPCDPPFTRRPDGVKVFKPECF